MPDSRPSVPRSPQKGKAHTATSFKGDALAAILRKELQRYEPSFEKKKRSC